MHAGCTALVESSGGTFFFMPNPKYHWSPEDVFNMERKIRFVAWWIHPDFCGELREWASTGSDEPGVSSAASSASPSKLPRSFLPSSSLPPTAEVDAGVGAPGDFGFSEVAKPAGYLHTCRDLAGEDHLRLLDALVVGTKQYLERILGDALPGAHISAGFHYPVRPQYSTLHLQCRVNSGDVCPGGGRGVDLFRLLHRLREDPEVLARDSETLFYEATANLRAALLGAAEQAGAPVKEVGPQSLVLGRGGC